MSNGKQFDRLVNVLSQPPQPGNKLEAFLIKRAQLMVSFSVDLLDSYLLVLADRDEDSADIDLNSFFDDISANLEQFKHQESLTLDKHFKGLADHVAISSDLTRRDSFNIQQFSRIVSLLKVFADPALDVNLATPNTIIINKSEAVEGQLLERNLREEIKALEKELRNSDGPVITDDMKIEDDLSQDDKEFPDRDEIVESQVLTRDRDPQESQQRPASRYETLAQVPLIKKPQKTTPQKKIQVAGPKHSSSSRKSKSPSGYATSYISPSKAQKRSFEDSLLKYRTPKALRAGTAVGIYADGLHTIEFENGVYEGYMKDNKRNGKGQYTWYDGNQYYGDWVDDIKEGQGNFVWSNGDRFVGDYFNDERNGKGIKTYKDGDEYKGDWKNGMKHGVGVLTSKNKDSYEGEFRLNFKEGFGTKRYASGAVYRGYWQKDKMHGDGMYKWGPGDFYQGQYESGYRQGHGIRSWASGTVYEVFDH